MGSKGTQPGRLSQTERAIDSMVRPGAIQKSSSQEGHPQNLLRSEGPRLAYIAACFLLDAVALPFVLAYIFTWLWIFIAAIVLVPLVYVEYKAYLRMFGPSRQVHHAPSDHIPEFHAADQGVEGTPELDRER
ncbi:MAG TPA: hypothetical protein VGB78_09705 [Thermoplasmata archaeon]